MIRRDQAGGRRRLRRLSDVAAALCRRRGAGVPTHHPRAERRDGPRQQGAGGARRRRSPAASCATGRRRCGDKIVVTGNPVRPAVLEAAKTPYAAVAAATSRSGCWSSAAARARSSSPTRCRRRSQLCPRRSARGCQVTQQARAEDVGTGRAAYAALGIAAEVLALLHRHGGADRRGASRDLALRRLDGVGDRGDRPAGAAGALSVCARPRPGGQCRGARGGRRRRGASAVDAVAGAARRTDRRR